MVTTSQPAVPDADGDDGDDPPVPRFEPMSVRGPALIVLGLAVVILLGGTLAAALTSTGPTPASRVASATLSDGTHVTFSPATSRLRSIVTNGQPPTDILGSLGVLTTSDITGTVDGDQGTTQFDRTVDLHTSPWPRARSSRPTASSCSRTAGTSSTRAAPPRTSPGPPSSWPRRAAATASTGRSAWSSPPPPRPGPRRTRSRCSRPRTATDPRRSRSPVAPRRRRRGPRTCRNIQAHTNRLIG